MTYISISAAVGLNIKIPIVLHSLVNEFSLSTNADTYKISLTSLTTISSDPLASDKNCKYQVLDSYNCQWWKPGALNHTSYLVPLTLDWCLRHHRIISAARPHSPTPLLPNTPVIAAWAFPDVYDVAPLGLALASSECPTCQPLKTLRLNMINTLSELDGFAHGIAVTTQAGMNSMTWNAVAAYELGQLSLEKETQSQSTSGNIITINCSDLLGILHKPIVGQPHRLQYQHSYWDSPPMVWNAQSHNHGTVH